MRTAPTPVRGEKRLNYALTLYLDPHFCGTKLAYKFEFLRYNQGPLNGGVSNGGVSRSGLVLPFLSFLGLSRFFWDFPDLRGNGSGIFPICPFPLSRPIKSSYEEQSRKGPRHNLDLSRKSGKHPGLETPRFSFSQYEMSHEKCSEAFSDIWALVL